MVFQQGSHTHQVLKKQLAKISFLAYSKISFFGPCSLMHICICCYQYVCIELCLGCSIAYIIYSKKPWHILTWHDETHKMELHNNLNIFLFSCCHARKVYHWITHQTQSNKMNATDWLTHRVNQNDKEFFVVVVAVDSKILGFSFASCL